MSNSYLCESCVNRIGSCPKNRVCWYKYADCAVRGIVKMPVMHDGIDNAADQCDDYDRGRARTMDCPEATPNVEEAKRI